MMYFRACPKCRGDVVFEQDTDGDFLECLQCGLVINSSHARSTAQQKTSEDSAAA